MAKRIADPDAETESGAGDLAGLDDRDANPGTDLDDAGYDGYDDDLDGYDDDYVYVPEDRGIARKAFWVVAFVIVSVLVLLGSGVYWLNSQINPGGDDTEEVTITIPKDAGLATIARLLEEKEVISNATIFRYYARTQNIGTVRAGEYDGLYKRDAMDDVIARLNRGPLPPKFTELTLREGLWWNDATSQIKTAYPEMNDTEIGQARDKLRSKYQPDGKPLDGFLFPARYRVEDPDRDNELKLMDQMVKKFDQVGDEIGLANASATLQGAAGRTVISPYDVIVIASLIEAEAKAPDDRARIARVVYNRLAKGMKLEIDATVLFALQEHKTEITKSDLEVDSPHNTRKYPGIPPWPINSPGKESLLAALNPSVEPGAEQWLYYVLIDEQGHHFFTGNYNEFLRKQQEARDKGLL